MLQSTTPPPDPTVGEIPRGPIRVRYIAQSGTYYLDSTSFAMAEDIRYLYKVLPFNYSRRNHCDDGLVILSILNLLTSDMLPTSILCRRHCILSVPLSCLYGKPLPGIWQVHLWEAQRLVEPKSHLRCYVGQTTIVLTAIVSFLLLRTASSIVQTALSLIHAATISDGSA